MKFLLIFMFIPVAFAEPMIVRTVEDIDYKGNMATVTFENGESFNVSRDHSAMPCLWNGWMAPQEVILEIDDETGEIEKCELYASGVKHLKSTRKIDY